VLAKRFEEQFVGLGGRGPDLLFKDLGGESLVVGILAADSAYGMFCFAHNISGYWGKFLSQQM